MSIARALAIEPGVLLMDEPFGAPDALTRAHLQNRAALNRVARERAPSPIMKCTHDAWTAEVLLSDHRHADQWPGRHRRHPVRAFARPRDRVRLAATPRIWPATARRWWISCIVAMATRNDAKPPP